MSEVSLRPGHLPKEERKNLLFISDDPRMFSGVGVQAREIMSWTAHKYNWISIAAAINHPEAGKGIDVNKAFEQDTGVPDAQLTIFPQNGYGDPALIRYFLSNKKIDGIVFITDPRFYVWLFESEHEIRQKCPLIYIALWDNLPYPYYNENYYESCDAIFAISKQSFNIHRQVRRRIPFEPWQEQYLPHGFNPDLWKKLDDKEELEKTAELRKKLFGEDSDKIKFVVLYNSRNIRRKQTSDVIMCYQDFLLQLPEEERESCRLLMHTQPVDENGTDLYAVLRDCAPEVTVVFSADRIEEKQLVRLYNNIDCTIDIANAEGFGLSTLQSLLTERMIIVNVTGGLQDQCGFVDENGEYLDPRKHYCKEWGTNEDGRYKSHGEWVLPVFPDNVTLIGSPPTPYIYESRPNYKEVATKILETYNLGAEERARRGKLGREFAMNPKVRMTSQLMAEDFIKYTDEVLDNWKPRHKFELIKA